MKKFQIYRSSDNSFRFRLKSSNGEIILISESYTTKQNCINGIEAVKNNAISDERYEKRTDKRGMNYFVLKSNNNQIIGLSGTYSSKAGLENAIYTVKIIAPFADIEDAS